MERNESRESFVPSLQRATAADIAQLIEIEKAVPKTEVYTPMTEEGKWREEMAENQVYLIKVGNKAVGSLAYQEKSLTHVYVSGLVIMPEYQGKGLGTMAMQYVLQRYPLAERIDLVTHPDNPALALYETLGFKVEKRVENYWGEGKPRLVLARKGIDMPDENA